MKSYEGEIDINVHIVVEFVILFLKLRSGAN